MKYCFKILVLGVALAGSCSDREISDDTPIYGYRVVNVYKHDRGAYTQGLVFDGGFLYEGTGGYGESTLRRAKLESGIVSVNRRLGDEYFGEGVAICGERIIQLTWQSGKGFVYDKETFKLVEEFSYSVEGWGLTFDGEQLILSDGSSTLYFLDAETFEETGRVEVYDGNGPVGRLNELEYVNGRVYANVWRTERIAIIEPGAGRVEGWIELDGILSETERRGVDVLNGIAYDGEGGRLFVTGKLWPKLFEIEVVWED